MQHPSALQQENDSTSVFCSKFQRRGGKYVVDTTPLFWKGD